MNDKSIYFINFVAILGTGIVAGVFLAFSTFVLAALGRLSPAVGISTMQMINITVINPLFMLVLFGSAALSLVLAYVAIRQGLTDRNTMLIAGAAFYLIGSIAVTMSVNVPLNDSLAALDPLSSESSAIWANYLQNWTFWNHVRGLTSIASCAAFIRAINFC